MFLCFVTERAEILPVCLCVSPSPLHLRVPLMLAPKSRSVSLWPLLLSSRSVFSMCALCDLFFHLIAVNVTSTCKRGYPCFMLYKKKTHTHSFND